MLMRSLACITFLDCFFVGIKTNHVQLGGYPPAPLPTSSLSLYKLQQRPTSHSEEIWNSFTFRNWWMQMGCGLPVAYPKQAHSLSGRCLTLAGSNPGKVPLKMDIVMAPPSPRPSWHHGSRCQCDLDELPEKEACPQASAWKVRRHAKTLLSWATRGPKTNCWGKKTYVAHFQISKPISKLIEDKSDKKAFPT